MRCIASRILPRTIGAYSCWWASISAGKMCWRGVDAGVRQAGQGSGGLDAVSLLRTAPQIAK